MEKSKQNKMLTLQVQNQLLSENMSLLGKTTDPYQLRAQ